MERPANSPPLDDVEDLGVEEERDVLDKPDVPDDVKSEIDDRVDAMRDSDMDHELPDDGE